MGGHEGFIPLSFSELSMDEMLSRAQSFLNEMNERRTTRNFSSKPVPRKLIEIAIETASTSPSGAHLQPWTFVAVSNHEMKMKIRMEAEREEKKSYDERMPESWLELLRPLGTDYVKEHITDAPWVVVLFRQTKRVRSDGEKSPTYYSTESVGIAAGMFITAIHHMGLCTLTHTPSPMGFLRELLERPEHETATLLLPVGYPSDDAEVPDLKRKSLDEVCVFFE